MSKMKALVKSKPEEGLWLEEVEKPRLGPNDLLVKVRKTAICGTDVHIYNWDEWSQETIPVPMTVGHEFAGVIEEHRAVRGAAGLFDVSHMGQVHVRGAGALDYLQYVTCNNVAKLKPGRAHYTALTTPAGTFVDDLLIYRLDEQEFLLVKQVFSLMVLELWFRIFVDRAGRP